MSPRKRPSREARMRRKRRTLLETQGYRCFYCMCFLVFEDATVDHLLPQSLGGSDQIENLAAACAPCNSRRGSRSVREMLRLTAPLALNCEIVPNVTSQKSFFGSLWEKIRNWWGDHA